MQITVKLWSLWVAAGSPVCGYLDISAGEPVFLYTLAADRRQATARLSGVLDRPVNPGQVIAIDDTDLIGRSLLLTGMLRRRGEVVIYRRPAHEVPIFRVPPGATVPERVACWLPSPIVKGRLLPTA